MRFKATITVDIPVDEDNLTAHRARLLEVFETVQADYPDARLSQKCQSVRTSGVRTRRDQPKHYTGRMRDYH